MCAKALAWCIVQMESKYWSCIHQLPWTFVLVYNNITLLQCSTQWKVSKSTLAYGKILVFVKLWTLHALIEWKWSVRIFYHKNEICGKVFCSNFIELGLFIISFSLFLQSRSYWPWVLFDSNNYKLYKLLNPWQK